MDDFQDVYAAKAVVTENLDKISRRTCKCVEHFVVFSSVIGTYGHELQSDYGYANVRSDRICEARAKMGYHALALQLGVIADVGYVADKVFHGREVAVGYNQYYKPQKFACVLETLEQLLFLRKPVCSSFIPNVTAAEEVKTKVSLLQRVLEIISTDVPASDLDLSVKLKDFGLDSLSAALIRQILQREYNMSQSIGNIGDISLSDLMQLDE